MIVYEIDPKKKYLLVSELPIKQLVMISKQIREWIASDDPFTVIQGDIRLEKACCDRPDVDDFIVGGLTQVQDFVARLAHKVDVDVPWADFDEDGNPSRSAEDLAREIPWSKVNAARKEAIAYAELIPVKEFMDSLNCEVEVEVIQESECKDYSIKEDNKGD